MPRIEAELGLTDIAHALLTHMPAEVESGESGAGDSFDIPVAWALTAEIARAEALLKSELEAHPTSTLWQEDYALQIRAAIALNQKQPEEAIEDLKPAEAFDLRSFDVPALRGRAYLAAQKPELAEAEFRKILNHSGIEPLSYNYPLAQLGLARALALEGKTAEAEDTYKMFFAAWKDADADLPRLKEAKAEYARLAGGAVKAKPAGSSQPTGKPALAKPSVSKPSVGKH
jgi:predicted Zn-dependent protease